MYSMKKVNHHYGGFKLSVSSAAEDDENLCST